MFSCVTDTVLRPQVSIEVLIINGYISAICHMWFPPGINHILSYIARVPWSSGYERRGNVIFCLYYVPCQFRLCVCACVLVCVYLESMCVCVCVCVGVCVP